MKSTERDASSSIRARHAAARVAPDKGFLAGSNTSEPRGSAPRERDHRGGDHPVPSRTRQLSPPSPRVLQREAAGGQGVALAEGAFLMRTARGPRGRSPLRASLYFLGGSRACEGIVPSQALSAFRAAGPRIRHLRMMRLSVWPSSRRRCGVRAEGLRRDLRSDSFLRRGWQIDLTVPAALRRHRACRGTPLQAFSACGCRKLL